MLPVRQKGLDAKLGKLVANLPQRLGRRLSDRWQRTPSAFATKAARTKRTILRDVRQRRVHVGESENVREQGRDRNRKIVNPHPALPGRRGIQNGALEVGVELLVKDRKSVV